LFFNGCTFTGCAVALSGPSTFYYKGKEEGNVAETLEGSHIMTFLMIKTSFMYW